MLKQLKQYTHQICMVVALLGTASWANATTQVDALSECLVKATTEKDKTAVLQWTFASLASHPDLQAFSQIDAAKKAQLDQKFAEVAQRIIVEDCTAQTQAVIQTDGIQAVAESFQKLGQSTGEEILKNPQVNQQLTGTLRYIDLNKLMQTFLTPDVLKQFGINF